MDDMKRFFYENFATMADTHMRATNDAELSKMIRDFAKEFGDKAGLCKAQILIRVCVTA